MSSTKRSRSTAVSSLSLIHIWMCIRDSRLVDSSLASHVTLDGVEVDADAVIGEVDAGDDILDVLLAATRTGAAAEMVGVGQGAMDMTVNYLKERKQFGKLIGEFQALQHRAAHLYGEMEVARATVMKAQQLLDEGSEGAKLMVSVAKAKAGRAANLAVREGVQMQDVYKRKYQGITFMLFDMESKGVTTKPILLISGNSPFCETFFDDVEVPKTQFVGEVNRGWDVAKYLLGHEREMISGGGAGGDMVSIGGAFAKAIGKNDHGELDDPILRAEMAAFDVDVFAYRAMGERFMDMWKTCLLYTSRCV